MTDEDFQQAIADDREQAGREEEIDQYHEGRFEPVRCVECGKESSPRKSFNGLCHKCEMESIPEATLSARVVVQALHPYDGSHGYIVRSRKLPSGKRFLIELIGEPTCRAWFQENELVDERTYDNLPEPEPDYDAPTLREQLLAAYK